MKVINGPRASLSPNSPIPEHTLTGSSFSQTHITLLHPYLTRPKLQSLLLFCLYLRISRRSSLTEHSVICKVCRDLVQLHPRYLYHVQHWQKHVRSECTGRVREEGDLEPPVPKRRRLTRGSEPVARTQMTLRSTRQTARRVEADRRLEQENFDDDETDVENIDELKHDDHNMAVAQCLTRRSENQFRTPLVESQGRRQTLTVSDSTRMNLVVAAQVWTGTISVGFLTHTAPVDSLSAHRVLNP
ncbi:hypothetical protein EV361DRAFT_956876 [Lentinula raphanica]|nr:hypothetical protein EV361DRAFT_956876 [Lentinula raphanica]